MNSENNKNIEKIFRELDSIGQVPKNIIKYGAVFFLMLLAAGTGLIVLNRHIFNLDPYVDFLGLSIVKTSFTVIAEIIVGSLLIDFLSQKV